MSFLSHLFSSATKPEPGLSPFVCGIIDSMVNHPTNWSHEGGEFVHAPTGMTVGEYDDGEDSYIEYRLSPGHVLEATRAEHEALSQAYRIHLVEPAKAREQAADLRAAQRTRAYFEAVRP